MDEYKGFFAALFDLSFTEFVTTKLIKLLFIIAILASGLGALFLLVPAIMYGSGASTILYLVIAPVVFLVSVLLSRIWLELVIVIFRIAENTTKIANQNKSEPVS